MFFFWNFHAAFSAHLSAIRAELSHLSGTDKIKNTPRAEGSIRSTVLFSCFVLLFKFSHTLNGVDCGIMDLLLCM